MAYTIYYAVVRMHNGQVVDYLAGCTLPPRPGAAARDVLWVSDVRDACRFVTDDDAQQVRAEVGPGAKVIRLSPFGPRS